MDFWIRFQIDRSSFFALSDEYTNPINHEQRFAESRQKSFETEIKRFEERPRFRQGRKPKTDPANRAGEDSRQTAGTSSSHGEALPLSADRLDHLFSHNRSHSDGLYFV